MDIAIASYPFTTIQPNRGIAFVRVECVENYFKTKCMPRFGYCKNGIRFVPVDLVDVAGLIEGSHEGLGLGNQFLSDIAQADVIIHIVDISGSTNAKGESCEPLSHDPGYDIKFIENELDLWFYGILSKNWARFSRQVMQEKTNIAVEITKQFSGLKITENYVEDTIKKLKLVREKPETWTENDLKKFCTELRKKSKPMIIAANKIDVNGAEKNLERLKKEFPDYMIIPCSAESELALKEANKKGLIDYMPGEKDFKVIDKVSEQQKKGLEFIKKNILEKFGSTGVQEIMDKAVFDLLKYIAIFPGGLGKLIDSEGRVLPDCFLLKPGSTAFDFAATIHTDLAKNFVKAIDVKKKLPLGKDHKLNNLDVVEIKTSK